MAGFQDLLDGLSEAEERFNEQQLQLQECMLELERRRTSHQELEQRLEVDKQHYSQVQQELEQRLEVSEQRCSQVQQEQKRYILEADQRQSALQAQLDSVSHEAERHKATATRLTSELEQLQAKSKEEQRQWAAERADRERAMAAEQAAAHSAAKAHESALQEMARANQERVESLQRRNHELTSLVEAQKQELSARISRVQLFEQDRQRLQAEEDHIAKKFLAAECITSAHRLMSSQDEGANKVVPKLASRPPLRHSVSDSRLPLVRSSSHWTEARIGDRHALSDHRRTAEPAAKHAKAPAVAAAAAVQRNPYYDNEVR